MDNLLQDVRYALRLLWKAPGFSAIVVLTMGLAIGATTSMFSVIEATMLRPLPFAEPGRLMMLYLTRSEQGSPAVEYRWAYPRFLLLQQSATAFESIATFSATSLNLTGAHTPIRVPGEIASASYFAVLRERQLWDGRILQRRTPFPDRMR